MARQVMRDPEHLAPLFLEERDRIETAWLKDPPESQVAFDEASDLVDRWAASVTAAADNTDVRPLWARRYWAKREADSKPQ